jgi:hypothetical protein
MNAVLIWLGQNPQAVKAFAVSILAWVGKGILAATGKTADLGNWSAFVDATIDILVGCLTGYGVGIGILHMSRGPALTPTESASVIVAALAPAPVALAVEQVKTIAAEVVIKAPVVSEMPESHRF